MKIEEVSVKDINKIYKLEKKVFKQNAFSKDLIKKLIQNKTFFLKIKKNNLKKDIIGFIIAVQDQADRMNIINFLINPKYHHKGFGTFLLHNLIKKIENLREIKRIILNVQIHNLAAINLYQKLGFKIIEKIEKYYQSREDAFLMEMKII